MNRLTKLFSYIVIAFLAAGIFSCSDIADSDTHSPENAGGAYITMSLSDSARTVLPAFDETALTDIVLTGTKSGEFEIPLGSWGSVSAMKTAAVPVSTGNWTFTLTAKISGTTLSATTPKEIVSGENAVSFALAVSEVGDGNGSFAITVSFAEVAA